MYKPDKITYFCLKTLVKTHWNIKYKVQNKTRNPQKRRIIRPQIPLFHLQWKHSVRQNRILGACRSFWNVNFLPIKAAITNLTSLVIASIRIHWWLKLTKDRHALRFFKNKMSLFWWNDQWIIPSIAHLHSYPFYRKCSWTEWRKNIQWFYLISKRFIYFIRLWPSTIIIALHFSCSNPKPDDSNTKNGTLWQWPAENINKIPR